MSFVVILPMVLVGDGDLETDEIIEDIADIEEPLEVDLWRDELLWWFLKDFEVGICIDKSFDFYLIMIMIGICDF